MRRARDRRGAVVVLVAFALLPLLAVCGLAVDLARGWLVQARLSQAVDAAALAGGRAYNAAAAEREAQARAIFWANFGRIDEAPGASGQGYMGATARQPEVSMPAGNLVRVTARAVLPTSLMRLVGQPEMVLVAQAETRITTAGMEVALALDVTGSMATNNNIGALRTAASNFVEILFGARETAPNLWISVVPWTTTVNVGPQHAGWLTPGLLNAVDYLPRSWAGCVEARAENGHDADELPPSSVPFTPFLWRSTLNRYTYRNVVVRGDNDWSALNVTEAQQDSLTNNAVGPNLGCPAAPILPLTAKKSLVLARIAALRATYRGGTMSNVGLQAAWFTISPLWRGLWGDASLPLDYGSTAIRKVAVLMTDGQNSWYDWPDGAPGRGPTYDNARVDADYTGYGRLSENRLGIVMPGTGNLTNDLNTANSRVSAEILARTQKICTAMKARGVTLYTITFGVNDVTTQDFYKACASSASKYFNSPSQAALQQAFSQIGSELISLRLSQ